VPGEDIPSTERSQGANQTSVLDVEIAHHPVGIGENEIFSPSDGGELSRLVFSRFHPPLLSSTYCSSLMTSWRTSTVKYTLSQDFRINFRMVVSVSFERFYCTLPRELIGHKDSGV
jgi:hypothetical protein